MEVHLSILVISIFILFLSNSDKNKYKFLFPVSALVITTYAAIRYDYGLDYWSYYEGYSTGKTMNERSFYGDTLYYFFVHLFPNYMSFIAVQSVLVFGSTLLYIRKYITPHYYWFCIFMLLSTPGLFANWISAIRCSLAAVVVWLAAYYFLQKKTSYVLYSLCVIGAVFFHTSAAIFIIIPVLNKLIPKMNTIVLMGILIAAILVGFFIPAEALEYVLSSSQMTQGYRDSYEGEAYNINGVIFKAVYIIPAFYIFKYKETRINQWDSTILSFVFLCLVLHFTSLDFQNRYTCFIFIYFVVAIAMVLPKLGRIEKLIVLVPLILKGIYGLHIYYQDLTEKYILLDGCPLFYHTIFESPNII